MPFPPATCPRARQRVDRRVVLEERLPLGEQGVVRVVLVEPDADADPQPERAIVLRAAVIVFRAAVIVLRAAVIALRAAAIVLRAAVSDQCGECGWLTAPPFIRTVTDRTSSLCCACESGGSLGV